jgi:hypothetical protein
VKDRFGSTAAIRPRAHPDWQRGSDGIAHQQVKTNVQRYEASSAGLVHDEIARRT